MGSWRDDDGNIYSAMSNEGEETNRDRFRCMVRAAAAAGNTRPSVALV